MKNQWIEHKRKKVLWNVYQSIMPEVIELLTEAGLFDSMAEQHPHLEPEMVFFHYLLAMAHRDIHKTSHNAIRQWIIAVADIQNGS